ncbi:hypothetical protein [Streptomyces chrestomyceticus]|uniref:hypothetical protein n=1 Tax=Streptomyces chrestomyceticus TaxID=68185 RepID=UPI0019D304E7|nr:hypothetical protein [Streptomyces chrestomyceticus]
MSAHQPVTAAVRNGAAEPTPTMNELLAACAAASAVSTPPQPPSRGEAAEDTENAGNAGNTEDNACEDTGPGPRGTGTHGAAARDAA